MSYKTPSITKDQFDACGPAMIAHLRRWYEEYKQNPDAPPANPATAAVWEDMPDIDSKAVVKTSPIWKKFLGTNLDPRLIRKGGYRSFDDLVSDLLPKLRSTCPDSSAFAAEGPSAN
jgi:hypothetical protein